MTGTLDRRTLNREQLLDAYRTMRAIREFEERVHREFATGEIPGFVHLYAGEEASAAGVCGNLDDRDTIASTHRGHGHCIAKGVDISEMMAEIYGRTTGSCHGKGGSMHIADLSKGTQGIDAAAAVAAIDGAVPVTVVWGTEDRIIPSAQAEAVARRRRPPDRRPRRPHAAHGAPNGGAGRDRGGDRRRRLTRLDQAGFPPSAPAAR